jgi:hypothetical protein
MKGIVALSLFWVVGLACAQTSSAPPTTNIDLFASARPQATVSVTKHRLGADLVQITVLNPQYSAEVLSKQIDALGKELHSEIRGLALTKDDYGLGKPELALPKASFAVDGLINASTGELRIGPVARALCGAPSPFTIQDFSLIFTSQKPGSNTLQRFRSDAVDIQSQVLSGGFGLEYRIRLFTQDPHAIDIPEGGPANAPKSAVPSSPVSKPNFLLWTLIAVASIATGALVYSLLLRPRPRARS